MILDPFGSSRSFPYPLNQDPGMNNERIEEFMTGAMVPYTPLFDCDFVFIFIRLALKKAKLQDHKEYRELNLDALL
jgi:hypothetical protein